MIAELEQPEEDQLHRIKLYKPTQHQFEIHNSKARYRVLACGRRWGKNYLALNDMLDKAWKHPDSIIYWCSPIYPQAEVDYFRFINWFSGTIQKSLDNKLRVELHNGSMIKFKGLNKPKHIEGEGLHYLYVDEASNVKKVAWENTLEPMLLDRDGQVLLIGTPKGKGSWFHKYYELGKDINEDRAEYESWHYRSIDSPYISQDRIDRIKAKIPERVFKQEYEGLFLVSGAGVFGIYNECLISGDIDQAFAPEQDKFYRMGVDLAKHQDWTVLTVIDIVSKRVVGFKRFNQLDYAVQKKIIFDTAMFWNNAEVVIDSTGLGEPIYDDLVRTNLHIIPFKFTSSSKIALIENLIVQIQNRQIEYPSINRLLYELDIFEFKTSPFGNIKYGHPDGEHDDCVISLALACWDIKEIIEHPITLVNKDISNYNDNNFRGYI